MHVAFLNLHNHKILLILILYRLNSEDKLLELIRLHLLFFLSNVQRLQKDCCFKGVRAVGALVSFYKSVAETASLEHQRLLCARCRRTT